MFSTDPSEPALFAVGQVSYGVFSLGQLAMGVVAIGQGAVGLVAIGQGGIGLYFGAGMLGVGARGFPVGIVPKFPAPRQVPDTTDLSQVRGGYGDGWVEATLGPADSGVPTLYIGDRPAGVRLYASLVEPARKELERVGTTSVVAHVRRIGEHLVCDRLLHVHVPPLETPGFWYRIVARTAVLATLAVPIVFYVVAPLFKAG